MQESHREQDEAGVYFEFRSRNLAELVPAAVLRPLDPDEARRFDSAVTADEFLVGDRPYPLTIGLFQLFVR